MTVTPTAFISYSWDSECHKSWVKSLAARLRSNGVDARLDQWETVPGDQLTHFMERGIRDHDFVLIICTPKYRVRSDARVGGVGYEGDIMTAEVISIGNDRKFIPVLRSGTWEEAAPSWLMGKLYIDMSEDPQDDEGYLDLVRTLRGERESAPPLRHRSMREVLSTEPKAVGKTGGTGGDARRYFEDIRITKLIGEEITEPRNDGTRGSALYTVPFLLSDTPPSGWAHLFIRHWDRPSHFTPLHRPGIARVTRDRILLEGTTVEEVEGTHLPTLKLAVNAANEGYRAALLREEQRARLKEEQRVRHRRNVDDVARRISFD